jgi:cytochrome c
MASRVPGRVLGYVLAGMAAVLLVSPAVAAEGDAKAGETVFKKCAACHNLAKPPKNGIGPSLVGVIGRKAGSVEGFKYSDAMKNATVIWDDAALDSYLKDPKGFIPNNKMVLAPLSKPDERANVIAYLKQAAK